ncbi:tetratricopeptide repeat protein [Streptomyces liangshanensis]|uniref:tetratricopeptide repeat protein n=1 Tax=Streptomyces liangshanensis TaxID=2717324 RepID=UPI0036D9ED2B
MDPQRLAWVGTGDPNGSGSGYLIGPQLVMTALHVVADQGRWATQVRARVGHPRFGSLEQRGAQVCWPDPQKGAPSPDAPDIALLWLDAPVSTTGKPVVWGRPGGTSPVPYQGAGFPAFAADTGSPAQVEALRGELSALSTSSAGWVLDCQVWPAPGREGERPWAGASGSAIFCHGRLVGVAVEDNRPMEWRRLHAAPIQQALGLPDFNRLVNRHGHPGTTDTVEEVTTAGGTPGTTEEVWPVVVGQIPPPPAALQPRRALRNEIDTAPSAGGPVVTSHVLSGAGGVGKTQLAAACATDALGRGTDLVVWAQAAAAQQVVAQYAKAAAALHLHGTTGEDQEADARALLKWLATTSRRWLVVLDGITDPTALGAWWPVSRTGTGRVLATTRLHDVGRTGGSRRRVDVPVYSPEESASYLRDRLTGDGPGDLLDDRATALAEALGHLPLTLGLAVAHQLNEALTCTAYLDLFNDRAAPPHGAPPEADDPEGHGPLIAAALRLSLDAVEATDTTGLAVPALRLAAVLDPAGHPHSLWTTPLLLDHLAPYHPDGGQITAGQTRAVLALLHRYALISHESRTGPRSVRIHPLTARAVRADMPEPDFPRLAWTAADALLHIWPEIDQPHRDLAPVLRANAVSLAQHADRHLWRSEAHPVLGRAGRSLLDAGLITAGAAYWQQLLLSAERRLGPDHPDTTAARANLATAHGRAGRVQEAVDLGERVVADRERLLGPDHLDTLGAQMDLALSYWRASRTQEAIDLGERVVADRERLVGPDHRNTIGARNNLASAYQQAGRTREAVDLGERVVADFERVLGPDHPDTLTARSNLAISYNRAGQTEKATAIEERVVADRERLLGADHPDNLTTRSNLASSYWQAGRTREAVVLGERVAADFERLLGRDHPDTLTARANLATCYEQAGRFQEAVDLLEQVVADRERILRPDHPDTIGARGNLASAYQEAGRTQEATDLKRWVVADLERVLGPDHPDTLTARSNLAASYHEAGRLQEAVVLGERVAADFERLLGPDHPDTLTGRANLAVMYWQSGRTQQAIGLLEQVVTDRERVLRPGHPDTIRARKNLAIARQGQGKASRDR